MIKKLILGTTLLMATFFVSTIVFAQQKTSEELKAEREQLKSEMKSKEAEERKEKYEKLESPKECGIQSVDGVASNSTNILVSTKEINAQLPELYKRTIGETIDGVTDVNVKKPTLDEVLGMATLIGIQIKALADVTESVKTASEDVKKASPLQAPKATKSLKYSKDVLSLTGPELNFSLKLVNHLVETIKSSNNY